MRCHDLVRSPREGYDRFYEPEYLRLIGQILDQTHRHSIMVAARAKGLIRTGVQVSAARYGAEKI